MSTHPSSLNARAWRFAIIGRIAVVALTVLPLLPTLRAPFMYDDTTVIRDNVALRGWESMWRVWGSPYWPSDGGQSLGLYRPLHLALLAGVWNMGGGSARWFHAYALTLALALSLAVWWLLRRGATTPAALVAALWFASHPLHVEVVASAANASESLVLLLGIAMVRVLWARDASTWMHAFIVACLSAAAFASKESGLLAAPVAFITAWGWHATGGTEGWKDYLQRHRHLVMASLAGIASVFVARILALEGLISTGSIAANGLDRLTAAERITAMVSVWPRIVAMVVWPTSLAPYYGTSTFPSNRLVWAVVGAMLLAGLALASIAAHRRGDRRVLVALAWIALIYLPASNLVTPTGQLLSDRVLLGVTVGFALMLAWGMDRIRPRLHRVVMVIAAVVIARNGYIAARYATAWTTHRTLWERLAEAAPEEHMSAKLLGMDARARGDYPAAIALLTRALVMLPSDRQVRFELGQAQYAHAAHADAVRTLEPLLRDSDVRSEREFVALYLDAVGRARGAQAVVHASRALLRSESAPVAALFLGTALEQLGNRAGADSAYLRGLSANPSDSALLARREALRARQMR